MAKPENHTWDEVNTSLDELIAELKCFHTHPSFDRLISIEDICTSLRCHCLRFLRERGEDSGSPMFLHMRCPHCMNCFMYKDVRATHILIPTHICCPACGHSIELNA